MRFFVPTLQWNLVGRRFCKGEIDCIETLALLHIHVCTHPFPLYLALKAFTVVMHQNYLQLLSPPLSQKLCRPLPFLSYAYSSPYLLGSYKSECLHVALIGAGCELTSSQNIGLIGLTLLCFLLEAHLTSISQLCVVNRRVTVVQIMQSAMNDFAWINQTSITICIRSDLLI